MSKPAKIITIVIIILVLLVGFHSGVDAQSISLGISPPLYEIMIMPGKEITQTYALTNNGTETIISVDLVPFAPGDEYGNPELQEFLPGYSLENVKTWFTIEDPKISWGGSFLLPRGGAREVTIKIAPPTNAPEGDYYFTILFKTSTEGIIGEGAAGAKATIGSNILMTVSENGSPKKIAKIKEFKAPILIDSFGTLSYTNIITNIGSAFFKPTGKIIVKPIFGTPIELDLAPLNILSSSERVIPCHNDEVLTGCTVDKKVFFGVYMATLTFQADGGGEIYEETITTIAFPFVIVASVLVAYFIIKLIRSYQIKVSRNN